MIMIKMVRGINLKKFPNLIVYLFFPVILLFLSSNAFSASNPRDCLTKKDILTKSELELIIQETEIGLIAWENAKEYNYLLSDLNLLYYCYQNINEKEKFFLKLEYLIDQKIISKNIYKNWVDEKLFFKEDWPDLFWNYLFIKQETTSKINKKKKIPDSNYFPKNNKDWDYIKTLFDILSLDKERNIEKIAQVIHFSYIEDDYNLDFAREDVLRILDEYINYTYNKKYYEYFIRFSRQKIEFLYGLNKKKCVNYFDNDFNKKLSKINLKQIKNYTHKTLRILETFEALDDLYKTAMYCKGISFEHAKEYAILSDFLIKQDVQDDTLEQMKKNKLNTVLWLAETYNTSGQKENGAYYVKEYEKLLLKFDVSDFEKIKFEKYKIQFVTNYLDIKDKEDDIFNLLNNLSKLTLENYQKTNQYADQQTFLFAREKLKLEFLYLYSLILTDSGRIIEAVKVLKEQINFYEALRGPNKYDYVYSDDELSFYKDTNTTLPSLYYQIIFLFKNIKDKSEFIKYSNKGFSLCEILSKNNFNYECYRVYLSYLNGMQLFETKDRETEVGIDKVVSIINKVDKQRSYFVNSNQYQNYSKINKAQLENDYIHTTVYALGAFTFNETSDEENSFKILDFKYRKKESSYHYLCRDDWNLVFRKNADLLIKEGVMNYDSLDLGHLAIKVACLYFNEEELTDSEAVKFIELIDSYLTKYESDNEKNKFIYLDKVGSTNSVIFHISGMLGFLQSEKLNPQNQKRIKDLIRRTFVNLQYQEAKFYVKTKKNFLNNFIDQDLKIILSERKDLKIKYKNLVSKIYSQVSSNIDNNSIINKKKLEKKLKNLNNKIILNYPEFSDINKIKIHKIKEIQNNLADDEALIYFINEESQQSFVITNKEFWSHTSLKSSLVAGRTKSWLDKLNKLTFKKNDDSELKNTGALIYDSIFKNTFKDIKNKRSVYIIADKNYSNFPFEMLITTERNFLKSNVSTKFKEDFEARYLIEDYNIKYLPNIDTFMNLERSSKTRITSVSKFLGVGDPKFLNNIVKSSSSDGEISFLRGGFIKDTKVISERYDELPFTGKELKEIGEIFNKASLLTREKASEKNIKDLNLKDYDVISFATHAEVFGSFKDFNEPFLVLSPPKKSSQNDDGLLTTSEISELDLDAELVILSACNTSSKSNKYAAGFSGLINSFFAAGSKSVIATHWPVEDEAGYLLMSETMKKVINFDQSISVALQNTKIEFIKGKYGEKFKKPLFWAPYVYVGL